MLLRTGHEEDDQEVEEIRQEIGDADDPARYTGRIIKVIDRAKARVLGLFRAQPDGSGRLAPIDKKQLGRELMIPRGAGGDAQDGELVAVEVAGSRSGFGLATARVTERLGSLKSERAVSMVAIAAHNQIGVAAVMFYLAAYSLMNIGAFAVITHFSRQGEKFVKIEDLAGLGWKQPVTAGLFAIFLLSFVGVPLTGGFFGKFYIFKAALDANLVWLAILGLLNGAVAAYYYLRILVVMYMNEPGEATLSIQPMGAGIGATLWVAAAGTLLLGIFPGVLLTFATNSSALIK